MLAQGVVGKGIVAILRILAAMRLLRNQIHLRRQLGCTAIGLILGRHLLVRLQGPLSKFPTEYAIPFGQEGNVIASLLAVFVMIALLRLGVVVVDLEGQHKYPR